MSIRWARLLVTWAIGPICLGVALIAWAYPSITKFAIPDPRIAE